MQHVMYLPIPWLPSSSLSRFIWRKPRAADASRPAALYGRVESSESILPARTARRPENHPEPRHIPPERQDLHLTDLASLLLASMKVCIRNRVALQLILLCASSKAVFGTSSSGSGTTTTTLNMAGATAPTTETETNAAAPLSGPDEIPISLCFSDVDGTLVHYPDDPFHHRNEVEDGSSNPLIFLPPSSTGMRGIISSRTLRLAQRLRSEGCVRLVLVSGMRGTTLLKRLPYLPRADAYACDAGGRIYYPVDCTDGSYDGPIIQPVEYEGATSKDLEPFGIVEDEKWKRGMQSMDAAGRDGYDDKTIEDRRGLLWDFARTLQSQGFVLDFKGYSTCFRVNRKQQNNAVVDDAKFSSLMKQTPPEGLETSVNLGCVDFYPQRSGKRNACHYLATKFAANGDDDDLLSKSAVCICDDDNDLEMAMACNHAFIPAITSESMKQTINGNPGKFTVTEDAARKIVETAATEEALTRVLAMLSSAAAS